MRAVDFFFSFLPYQIYFQYIGHKGGIWSVMFSASLPGCYHIQHVVLCHYCAGRVQYRDVVHYIPHIPVRNAETNSHFGAHCELACWLPQSSKEGVVHKKKSRS